MNWYPRSGYGIASGGGGEDDINFGGGDITSRADKVDGRRQTVFGAGSLLCPGHGNGNSFGVSGCGYMQFGGHPDGASANR